MARVIIWTSQSLEDIEIIAEYIAKDSIKYAQYQVMSFFSSVEILNQFPRAGKIVPEIKKSEFRQLICGSYRVIYYIKSEKEISILTIYHVKRKLNAKSIK